MNQSQIQEENLKFLNESRQFDLLNYSQQIFEDFPAPTECRAPVHLFKVSWKMNSGQEKFFIEEMGDI